MRGIPRACVAMSPEMCHWRIECGHHGMDGMDAKSPSAYVVKRRCAVVFVNKSVRGKH